MLADFLNHGLSTRPIFADSIEKTIHISSKKKKKKRVCIVLFPQKKKKDN